ncbi:unnamed protein product [Allacma fusca]|uniref:Nudix hydrolase domain-containing protein n=1 Tax=Allacma fusca TaxID=39272 RepID=A0A8J2JKJ2_9HEXA|nr:unnamed protein product [Allacma fusca]
MLLNTNPEENKESKLSPVLQLAQRFNVFFLTKLQSSYALPFIVEGYIVGLIRPDVLNTIKKSPLFKVYSDSIELTPKYGHDYETRSREIEAVINEWRKNKAFVTLNGWRDELYEVRSGFDDPPLLKMERSATCLFGIRQYGVDINGYVHHPTKGLCVWLQKRSITKQTWPGKMDNMVGGGLAVGYSVIETALKESNEEASIPEDLLANLQPVGTVSYFFESERGLFPNTHFVYDLELPLDFVPINQDGEVESFTLVTLQEALDWALAPEFKTTSCPVILDFLVRHGFITPQNEPDFPQLMELLHVPLHSIFKQITIPSSSHQ